MVWRGPGSTSVADEVELTWSPLALWSGDLVVRSFAAKRLEVDVAPSDSATAPPSTLALPFEVTIERVAVDHLDWHVGPHRGMIEGLTFAYAGGANEHRITTLSLSTPLGTVTGEATIGARSPFPARAQAAFDGAEAMKGTKASLRASGTLAALAVDGTAESRQARAVVHAALSPFNPVALSELTLDATDVDLAAFDPSLPRTRIALAVRAQPADGGLAGHVDATNADPGDLDTHRVPLRALSAKFAWREDELALDDLAAALASGTATGRARIPLLAGGAEGAWWLDVRDVD
jgi:hypothetical protein